MPVAFYRCHPTWEVHKPGSKSTYHFSRETARADADRIGGEIRPCQVWHDGEGGYHVLSHRPVTMTPDPAEAERIRAIVMEAVEEERLAGV